MLLAIWVRIMNKENLMNEKSLTKNLFMEQYIIKETEIFICTSADVNASTAGIKVHKLFMIFINQIRNK